MLLAWCRWQSSISGQQEPQAVSRSIKKIENCDMALSTQNLVTGGRPLRSWNKYDCIGSVHYAERCCVSHFQGWIYTRCSYSASPGIPLFPHPDTCAPFLTTSALRIRPLVGAKPSRTLINMIKSTGCEEWRHLGKWNSGPLDGPGYRGPARYGDAVCFQGATDGAGNMGRAKDWSR